MTKHLAPHKKDAEKELMRELSYLVLRMNRRQHDEFHLALCDELEGDDFQGQWPEKIAIAERILDTE